MELKIDDLRLLLNRISFYDFKDFCSDSECQGKSTEFRDSQARMYDTLDLFIRLLQELSKYRPLPF